MNRNYRFMVDVEMPGGERKRAAFEVAAYIADPICKAYDLCDDAVTALIVGGVTAGMAERIDVDRRGFAKEMAERLTDCLLDGIKSRDTRNGYEQNPSLQGTGHLVDRTMQGVVLPPDSESQNKRK